MNKGSGVTNLFHSYIWWLTTSCGNYSQYNKATLFLIFWQVILGFSMENLLNPGQTGMIGHSKERETWINVICGNIKDIILTRWQDLGQGLPWKQR